MFNAIASSPWAYPALEVVHIVGIGLLIGNLLLFELRVWGLGLRLPLEDLGRLALSLVLVGFALAVASGLLMFATEPDALLSNPAFVLKMGLLMLAGTNAAFFHARGGWARMDRVARLLTLVSIGLWLAVILCGRAIAYL